MQSIKLWIIGRLGLLGKALISLCEKRSISYVSTTRQEVDIEDRNQVVSYALKMQPTHIINAAAYTNVDGAEKEKDKAFAVNAWGAEHVAYAACVAKARCIHVSTDYVFDGAQSEPYFERSICRPLNVYGMSKWEGEKRVLAIDTEACIVRTSWLFGGEGKNVASMLWSWLQEKERLQVVEDQCGRPTYSDDLAQAVLDLLEYGGIIHFANEGVTSRYQMACDMRSWMLKRGKYVRCQVIEPVASSLFPRPAQRPAYSVLDTSRYQQYLGKQPRPWIEALEECFG